MRERRKIEWTIGEKFDDAGDGHCFFHYANGKDQYGNTFTGVAVLVDGHLEEIESISWVD